MQNTGLEDLQCMGFQGSGGRSQECNMKKIVVTELFIVLVFLTPWYKLSHNGNYRDSNGDILLYVFVYRTAYYQLGLKT